MKSGSKFFVSWSEDWGEERGYQALIMAVMIKGEGKLEMLLILDVAKMKTVEK